MAMEIRRSGREPWYLPSARMLRQEPARSCCRIQLGRCPRRKSSTRKHPEHLLLSLHSQWRDPADQQAMQHNVQARSTGRKTLFLEALRCGLNTNRSRSDR